MPDSHDSSTGTTGTTGPTPTAHPFDAEANAAEVAYGRLRPQAMALPASEIEVLNVDLDKSTRVSDQALPALIALRPQIIEELPHWDIRNLDLLHEITLATWYVYARNRSMHVESDEIAALIQEGTGLKDLMLPTADALVARGLFNRAEVEAFHSGNGNYFLCNVLVGLSGTFHENWSAVQNKVAVEQHEVERAAVVGNRLRTLLTARDNPNATPDVATPTDERQRFWTLLFRAYEECRAVVRFLRRKEGDADKITPTLRVTTARRSPAGSDGATTTTEDAGLAETKNIQTAAAAGPAAPVSAGPKVGDGKGPFG